MLELLTPFKHEILGDMSEAQSIASKLRTTSKSNWVITHGDPLGNIMKGKNGEVYLVDWDDAFFAPAERDTWLNLTSEQKDKFLPLYKKIFPGYEVNKIALKFYVLRRYIDDLEGFIINILDVKTTDEQKADNLKQLKHDCFEWLQPIIRTIE